MRPVISCSALILNTPGHVASITEDSILNGVFWLRHQVFCTMSIVVWQMQDIKHNVVVGHADIQNIYLQLDSD